MEHTNCREQDTSFHRRNTQHLLACAIKWAFMTKYTITWITRQNVYWPPFFLIFHGKRCLIENSREVLIAASLQLTILLLLLFRNIVNLINT